MCLCDPARDRSGKPEVRGTCAKAGPLEARGRLGTPACRNGSTGRDSPAPIFFRGAAKKKFPEPVITHTFNYVINSTNTLWTKKVKNSCLII